MGSNVKRAIRERMAKTGESYSTARMRVVGGSGGPPEPPGFKAQIERVLAAEPDLTIFGFRPVGGNGDGNVSRVSDPVRFHAERAQLLGHTGIRQVERCVEYFGLVRKTRSAKPREGRDLRTSYGLKHEVEGWLRRNHRDKDEDAYAANGALIVAALIVGVPIHPIDRWSPNCYVGVDPEDVRALREGKDPREWRKTTRFVKWLFEQAGRPDPVGDLGGDCKADFDFLRQGNVATIRDHLATYGEHVEQAFRDARMEYRTRPRSGPGGGTPDADNQVDA